ncbi:MAG: hypothetical protein OEY38_06755, partial [Gammaproteobacteria bacterium]|nr:hypothetical protein [Gammaproteobacteria bacterium]
MFRKNIATLHRSNPFFFNFLTSIIAAFGYEIASYLFNNWDKLSITVSLLTEIVQGSTKPYFIFSIIIFSVQLFFWGLRKRELSALATHAGLNIFLSNSGENEDQINIEKKLATSAANSRTIKILGATGFNTFGNNGSFLFDALQNCTGTISVILLDPSEENESAEMRAKALGLDFTDYRKEIVRSVNMLAELKRKGKRVNLYFYKHLPLW